VICAKAMIMKTVIPIWFCNCFYDFNDLELQDEGLSVLNKIVGQQFCKLSTLNITWVISVNVRHFERVSSLG
jgi:hypothetical protein